MKINMKINIGIVALIIISAFMYGCESESKEIKTNTIYPMQLESNETKLMNLLVGSNSTALLSATLDDTFRKVKIFSEAYCEGELVHEQDGLSFELWDTLDLAISSRGVGSWGINARSGNSVISSNLNMEEQFNIDENMLQAWNYLSYEVSVTLNNPQIIGVCYFDDSNSIGHETAVYENNKINNMKNYKYLYVIKIVFE
jgi:hypothetical protein